MATKTYSFTIMGQFNKESFILAQAMLNDAFKTFPDVRVQSIQLTEWETTQEPVENNVVHAEEVSQQENAVLVSENARLSGA